MAVLYAALFYAPDVNYGENTFTEVELGCQIPLLLQSCIHDFRRVLVSDVSGGG